MAKYIDGIKLYRTPKVKYSKDRLRDPSSREHPHVILGEKIVNGKRSWVKIIILTYLN